MSTNLHACGCDLFPLIPVPVSLFDLPSCLNIDCHFCKVYVVNELRGKLPPCHGQTAGQRYALLREFELPTIEGNSHQAYVNHGTCPKSCWSCLYQVNESYRRDWFVLDHVSLRAASNMESTLSAASSGAPWVEAKVLHQAVTRVFLCSPCVLLAVCIHFPWQALLNVQATLIPRLGLGRCAEYADHYLLPYQNQQQLQQQKGSTCLGGS